MTKIKLQYSNTWHDCDDCGAYVDDSLNVYKDGELIAEHFTGGHFGTGTVDLNNSEATLVKVLENLGYEVEVEYVKTT